MGLAIGLSRDRGQAAEPELFRRRITDRPFAGPLGQLHQGQLAGALLDLADAGERLGADLVGRGLRRQRLAGRHDRPARGEGGHRRRLRRGVRRLDLGRLRLGRGFRFGHRLRPDRGHRLGRRGRRRRLLVAVRQAQAMDLADHRIAGHAAQFLGDLAGGLTLGPHPLQRLDPLVRPGHRAYPIFRQNCLAGPGPKSGMTGHSRSRPRLQGARPLRGPFPAATALP